MKLQFLGTAAAEAIPGVFCECEICKKSRELGGKNIRTRSQLIIDDKILVDFPADTYMHYILYNINLPQIKTCIITHSHFDHLYPAEFWCKSPGIANGDNIPTITVYAASDAYQKLAYEIMDYDLNDTNRIKIKKITPFVPFEAEGYTITPLKANHDIKSDPVIYLIQKDNKSLLYAHDTGYFPEETVDYLKKSKVKLDCISFDCTGGTIPDENYSFGGHMNLIGNVKMAEILNSNGNITSNTKLIINHFSHNGTPTHDEMSSIAAKKVL